MSLKCRSPQGVFSITGLKKDQPFLSLLEIISSKSGVPIEKVEILAGFPPKPLKIHEPHDVTIAGSRITLGDTLTIRESNTPSILSKEDSARVSSSRDASPSGHQETAPKNGEESSQGDEDLAKALAMSLQSPLVSPPRKIIPPKANIPQHHGTADKKQTPNSLQESQKLKGSETSQRPQSLGALSHNTSHKGAPTEVGLSDGSFLTRRIVASDNSCLFNAVGYVMERSRSQSKSLRSVIAEAVRSDPETYSDAFLGKSNSEYQKWIQDSQRWGGAIELSILSRHFAREIAAYDIYTKRMDVYGEDEGYSERAMLIYDGLHYDALAQAAFKDAPEELDITIFEKESSDLPSVIQAASELVTKAHNARQFTDTGTFTLRCGTCQIGVKGAKEAQDHAKTTGHTNFQEYS